MLHSLMTTKLEICWSLGIEILDILMSVPKSLLIINLKKKKLDSDILSLPLKQRAPILTTLDFPFLDHTILIQALSNVLFIWAIPNDATQKPLALALIHLPVGNATRLDPNRGVLNVAFVPEESHEDSIWCEIVTSMTTVSKEIEDGQQHHIFVGTSSGRVLGLVYRLTYSSAASLELHFLRSLWLRQVPTYKAVHTIKVREVVRGQVMSHSCVSSRPTDVWLLGLRGCDLEAWRLHLEEGVKAGTCRVQARWQSTDQTNLCPMLKGFATYRTDDNKIGVVAADHKTDIYTCVVERYGWTKVTDAHSSASSLTFTGWAELRLQEVYEVLYLSSVPDSQKLTANTDKLFTVGFTDLYGTLNLASHNLHISGDVCIGLSLSNPLLEFLGAAVTGLHKHGSVSHYLRSRLLTFRVPIRSRQENAVGVHELLTKQLGKHQTGEEDAIESNALTPLVMEQVFAELLAQARPSTANSTATKLLQRIIEIHEDRLKSSQTLALGVICLAYCFISIQQDIGPVPAGSPETLLELFLEVVGGVLTNHTRSLPLLKLNPNTVPTVKRTKDFTSSYFELTRLVFILRGLCFREGPLRSNAPTDVSFISVHPDQEVFDSMALTLFSRVLLSSYLAADGSQRLPSTCTLLNLPAELTPNEQTLLQRCAECLRIKAHHEKSPYTLESLFRMNESVRASFSYCLHCLVEIELCCSWLSPRTCIYCGGTTKTQS
eukprot:Blabericola_migrator_1__5172@NODE_2668_length_2481_cov_73_187655_g202_i1_p1_GENE_NODE_2668_length_2481_cov_73_187655_g202_i1NODE_2668_length_2481_cov_73_187655_g202_i1_p1_ORF_typecomplete_len774_score97_31Med25_VWA/PF11265_8/2_4e02Med25_VWA/PF11265_8/0_47DUF4187/PF13821_6/0_84DUF4187/PF13821_6/7_2e02_NODE_2668_length_2481_cov_73_187655_g202_i11712324